MPRAKSARQKPVEHITTDFGSWLLEDFPRFCKETRLIFPWYDQPVLEMAAEMEFTGLDEERKTQQRKLFLAPRGSWKTSLVIARIIFLLLKYPQIKLLLYRSTRETSQQMLREVKGQLMTNPVILENFGDLSMGTAKWDEDAIIIGTRKVAPGDRDPSVMTIGTDGQTAGFHPDGVFMDDVVTEQNCDSPQLMDKAWRIMQSVYGLLPPWGWSLVTGTRWSAIDCYQRIIDINKQCDEAEVPRSYDEYIRTVYVANPETGEQELFFPARLSQEFIESQRNNPALETRYFESWYFNRMVDPRAKPFKMQDLKWFDCEYSANPYKAIKLTDAEYAGEELPLYVAMIVDPAQTGNISSDAYGISVVGWDANRNFMVLESRELIDLPSNADHTIFDLLLLYQPDILIIESSGGDAGLVSRIGAFIERNAIRTVVRGYSPLQDEPRGKRSKPSRINAMEPYVSTHHVFIRRGFCNELVRQMDLWPSLVRDDVIDSWAMSRHVLQKYVPDAKEINRLKEADTLEKDAYAVTFIDKSDAMNRYERKRTALLNSGLPPESVYLMLGQPPKEEDAPLGKEVTMGWDQYHGITDPQKASHGNISKGTWVGRNTKPPSPERKPVLK